MSHRQQASADLSSLQTSDVADADMVKTVGVQNFMRFHDRFFGRMFLSGKSESDISNNFGILMATYAPQPTSFYHDRLSRSGEHAYPPVVALTQPNIHARTDPSGHALPGHDVRCLKIPLPSAAWAMSPEGVPGAQGQVLDRHPSSLRAHVPHPEPEQLRAIDEHICREAGEAMPRSHSEASGHRR